MQTIGRHAVTNQSIEHAEVDDLLASLMGRKVSVLYSDPPWGDGNMKYWVTMNKKMTGRDCKPLTYEQLLSRIFGFIHWHVDGHVFIETGVRWGDMLARRFVNEGLFGVSVFNLRYASGSTLLQNSLVFGGTAQRHKFEGLDPCPYRGADLVRRVVGHVKNPGGIVFDPCCGMGYTARAAIASGMDFIGNEFNAARLAKTVAILSRA